jgi:glutathione S-transferase
MAITFYYSPGSSATRVHWALEELGVPYEKVKLDLRAGDQKKPEFLKLNPNGKVPTLVDDGAPMFESLAMLIHLGEKYGVAKGLWPKSGTPEHMQALSWATWAQVTLAPLVFRVMMNTSERFAPELRNAGQAEAAKHDVEGLLKLLDAQLAGKPYILGERFTLADVGVASVTNFASRIGVDLAGYTHVAPWAAQCAQRPAMVTAAAG